MLCSASLLTHFDPLKLILTHVDVSPYGIGIVMAHKMDNGCEKTVLHFTYVVRCQEKLDSHWKGRVSTCLLSKRNHQYLYGNFYFYFLLSTWFVENKAHSSFCTPSTMLGTISVYSYKLEYHVGSSDSDADCLSFLPVNVLVND